MQHVYVIEIMGGPVKIGVSGNPEHRLLTLQSANPYPLRLAAVFHGKGGLLEIERGAHHTLRQHHAGREWFSCSVDQARAAIMDVAAARGIHLASGIVLDGRQSREPMPVKKLVAFRSDQDQRIKGYMGQHGIPTEADAIRRLLHRGLVAEGIA